jgi:ElaA protein
MKIEIKKFQELTSQELYDILQLRSEVFVVEQDCVYQDLDGKDKKALHIIGYKDDKVVAYTRIFRSGDYFHEASIGRVVVKPLERKFGYGVDIMKASIAAVENLFKETTIHLSAQCYLKNFYNSLGFKEVGAEYLEDGIPHIGMTRNK